MWNYCTPQQEGKGGIRKEKHSAKGKGWLGGFVFRIKMNEIFFFVSCALGSQTRQQTEFPSMNNRFGDFLCLFLLRGLFIADCNIIFPRWQFNTHMEMFSRFLCNWLLKLFDPKKKAKAFIGLWSYKALLMQSHNNVFTLQKRIIFALLLLLISAKAKAVALMKSSSNILSHFDRLSRGIKGKILSLGFVFYGGDSNVLELHLI